MIIFSAVILGSLPFLFFISSLKFYRTNNLANLATKGFLSANRKLKDWQEKNPYASEFDPKLQDLKLASVGAYMIFLIAWGLNDENSLKHLDEYFEHSFLGGED